MTRPLINSYSIYSNSTFRKERGAVVPLHVHKKAVRALGIAESFVKGVNTRSVLAGVVMRTDGILDGFVFSTATVGGMDQNLERDDINFLMLNGCIISWYNVIDLHTIADETQRPLLCVTYEESEGLEKYFIELFPEDWESRVEVYHKNGFRIPIKLNTNHTIYARFINMKLDEAEIILNRFTLHGSIPEPLRVARLIARAIVTAQLNLNRI
jgi:endonuclease V-like protein UPF0215 family